jgi:RimJ/RimL family protein N-acetyltransferase
VKNNIITFTPLTHADIPLVYDWFQQPDVARWWPTPHNKEEFTAIFNNKSNATDLSAYIIHLDNKPIGYLQSYAVTAAAREWLPPLPEKAVGIDLCIGDAEYRGKGYGIQIIAAFLDHLRATYGPLTVIVDPAHNHLQAIKAYKKAGFVSQGVYTGPEGLVEVLTYSIND